MALFKRRARSDEPAAPASEAGSSAAAPTYCHLCGSTEGPFTLEVFPAGLASTGSFAKCARCTGERGLGHISLGQISRPEDVKSTFVACEGCGSLFWSQTEGVAYAWERFDLADCPVCGHSVPQGEAVEYADPGYVLAQWTSLGARRPYDKVAEAYRQLTAAIADDPRLATVVQKVLLTRRDDDHHALVVVGRGLNKTAAARFGKMSGLLFASSGRVDDQVAFLADLRLDLLESWERPGSSAATV